MCIGMFLFLKLGLTGTSGEKIMQNKGVGTVLMNRSYDHSTYEQILGMVNDSMSFGFEIKYYKTK